MKDGERPRFVLPLLVFLAVLAVRSVYWAALERSALAEWYLWQETDEHGYLVWSHRLAAGNWMDEPAWRAYVSWQVAAGGPDVWNRRFPHNAYFQGPLYPYLLALCWKLAGSPILPFRLLQLLLASATAAAVATAVRRLLSRSGEGGRLVELAAAGAGLAYGLYGPGVFHDGFLYRDGPLAHLSTLLLVLPLSPRRPASSGGALGLGLLGGLAILAKQTVAPLSALAVWVLSLSCEEPARRRRALILGSVGLAVPVLALVARNAAVGAPLLAFDTRQTLCLVWANARGADATVKPSPHLVPILDAASGSTWKAARLIVASYGGHWSEMAILPLKKLATFFHRYEVPDNASYDFFRDRLPVLPWLPVWGCVVGPGLVGLAWAARKRLLRPSEAVLAAVAFSAPLLSCLLVSTTSRYRILVLGPLALGCGLFAVLLVKAFLRRERAAAIAPPVLLAAGLTAVTLLPPVIPTPRHRFSDTLVLATLVEARGEPEAAVGEVERYLREGGDDADRRAGLTAMRLWLDGNRAISNVAPAGIAPPERRAAPPR